MKKRINDGEAVSAEKKKGKVGSQKILTAIATAVLSVVLVAIYYFSLAFEFFPIVMWGYMIALAVLALTYVIYNRGFSRKGVTEEMLPDEWSPEEKTLFIRDGERRLRRSKWMLVLIVAFFVTFAVEAWLLFVNPLLAGLLGL